MRGQAGAAGGEDFALQSRMRRVLVAQHHVGHDQRAHDRIPAREHAARADRFMRVERLLDFFGVNLAPPTLMTPLRRPTK